MGYMKAEEILPCEVIELIQQYVDGQNIYIPKKSDTRTQWGARTNIRQELRLRNEEIFYNYQKGRSVQDLADQYYLSVKSIQRILREMKSKSNGPVP